MSEKYFTTSTNRMIQCVDDQDLNTYQFLREIDRNIQDLIIGFNLGVEKMSTTGDPAYLKDYTTEKGLERFKEKHINWKRKGIIKLRLLSYQFLSFTLTDDQQMIQAYTFEKWSFGYENEQQIATEGSVDGYDIRKIDGKWLIDSVTFYAPATNLG